MGRLPKGWGSKPIKKFRLVPYTGQLRDDLIGIYTQVIKKFTEKLHISISDRQYYVVGGHYVDIKDGEVIEVSHRKTRKFGISNGE